MAGGFRPIQDISGNSYTGKIQTFAVAAAHTTLLAVGDIVRITGTARAADGLAEVDAAAAAQTVTGPIVAVDFNISNLEQKGLPALTAGTVKVAVDRDMLMEAEASTTVALVDVGANADIVATVASSSGGLVNSNMVVNTTSPAAATAQIRIVGLKDGLTASGSTIFCRINESTNNVVGV
jgi:hypothetical protein